MKMIVLGFLMICVPALAFAADNAGSKPQLEPFYFQTAAGKRHDFKIEVADTLEARQNGLMFRQSLDKGSGMLFLFENEEPRVFWMKNTLIPLDMIFMNKQGVILDIHPNAIPHDESLVKSESPASAVLEINGGQAAELGLKPGDIAHHASFGNMLADEKTIQ